MSVPAVTGKKRKKRRTPTKAKPKTRKRRIGAVAKKKTTRRRKTKRIGKANATMQTLLQIGLTALGATIYKTTEKMIAKSQEEKPEEERLNPMYLQVGAPVLAAFASGMMKEPMLQPILFGFGAAGAETLISDAVNKALGVTGIGEAGKYETVNVEQLADLIPVNGYANEAANQAYKGVGNAIPSNINIRRAY